MNKLKILRRIAGDVLERLREDRPQFQPKRVLDRRHMVLNPRSPLDKTEQRRDRALDDQFVGNLFNSRVHLHSRKRSQELASQSERKLSVFRSFSRKRQLEDLNKH